jgi:hypothetical protein
MRCFHQLDVTLIQQVTTQNHAALPRSQFSTGGGVHSCATFAQFSISGARGRVSTSNLANELKMETTSAASPALKFAACWRSRSWSDQFSGAFLEWACRDGKGLGAQQRPS